MPRKMRGLCRFQKGTGQDEREKEASGGGAGHRDTGTGTDAEHKKQEVKEMAFVAEFERKGRNKGQAYVQERLGICQLHRKRKPGALAGG